MEKQAAGLSSYYKRELAKYDRRLHNTQREDTGLLVRLCQFFGELEALVWGPGEMPPRTYTSWFKTSQSAGLQGSRPAG